METSRITSKALRLIVDKISRKNSWEELKVVSNVCVCPTAKTRYHPHSPEGVSSFFVWVSSTEEYDTERIFGIELIFSAGAEDFSEENLLGWLVWKPSFPLPSPSESKSQKHC